MRAGGWRGRGRASPGSAGSRPAAAETGGTCHSEQIRSRQEVEIRQMNQMLWHVAPTHLILVTVAQGEAAGGRGGGGGGGGPRLGHCHQASVAAHQSAQAPQLARRSVQFGVVLQVGTIFDASNIFASCGKWIIFFCM